MEVPYHLLSTTSEDAPRGGDTTADDVAAGGGGVEETVAGGARKEGEIVDTPEAVVKDIFEEVLEDPCPPVPVIVNWDDCEYLIKWEDIVVAAAEFNRVEKRENSAMTKLQGI